MEGQPADAAMSTTCSGVWRSIPRPDALAFEMFQFWQKRQPRLQPTVPKERTSVPGRKW